MLSQSDIFAHFGSNAKTSVKKTSQEYANESTDNKTDKSKKNHRASTDEEQDEDEIALGDGDGNKSTILLTQPKTISGGEMR